MSQVSVETSAVMAKLFPAAAALAGSIIALKFMEGASNADRAVGLVIGFTAAIFLSPWIASSFTSGSDAALRGVALLVGLFGMGLVGGLMKLVHQFREQPRNLADWVLSWTHKFAKTLRGNNYDNYDDYKDK